MTIGERHRMRIDMENAHEGLQKSVPILNKDYMTAKEKALDLMVKFDNVKELAVQHALGNLLVAANWLGCVVYLDGELCMEKQSSHLLTYWQEVIVEIANI